jgi:hypothetical protein
MIHPKWNNPEFIVESDTPWRAQYRALQSWYRETVLGVPAGLDAQGVQRGNLLPRELSAIEPWSNFLTPEIAEYVEARVPVVREAGGTLDKDRLTRNLLSSMPLCFNIFGYLRVYPVSAARVFSKVLGLDIAFLENIEVEWTPRGDHPLQDRTAFDAFVEYRTRKGTRGFLGVETKYTEPFSQKEYAPDIYREITESPASGFRKDATSRLKGIGTNQLWRNALLAVSVRSSGSYAFGHVLVMAPDGDPDVSKALDGICAELVEPSSLVLFTTLQTFIAAAETEPLLKQWAQAFRHRYLDLDQMDRQA